MWWYNMWRSTSYEYDWEGRYNMWRSNIKWFKSRWVTECGIGFHDIMCDDIIFKDLHLARMVGMYNIICDDITYNDLNPYLCDNTILGLMI